MIKKFNWGHGVVLALVSFMIFILSLIFFFSRGWQNSELISNDYYAEDLAFQEVIDAKKNADQLQEKPTYLQDTNGIKVIFPNEINNTNSKFKIVLHRADDQRLDIKKEMMLGPGNSLFIPKNVLVKGNYVLRVSWQYNNKKYQLDYDLIW